MGMNIDREKNILIFDIPNSEAKIEAQHKGIKDREVGMYYLSGMREESFIFFNKFEGNFFADVGLSLLNAKILLNKLKNNNLSESFKNNLIPQTGIVESLERYLIKEKDFFHKMKTPSFSKDSKNRNKYFKLDLENDAITSNIITLCLGELTSLNFRKFGDDCFVMFLNFVGGLDKLINDGSIKKWASKSNSMYKSYTKNKPE